MDNENNEQHFNNGANIDTRTEEEKLKDYHATETIASFAPVNWVEKTQEQWRKFPIFNQDGSGSCVMQTQCKELGILRWLKDKIYVHFSAGDGYQRRSNKPEGGMAAADARKIGAEGVTLEALTPSQGLNDKQMDALLVEQYKHDVGAVFKVPNYLTVPIKDIEAIASVIQQTGKGVMVWFYFEYREWTDHPVVMNPNLELGASATCRHSVTAVDFALVNGKKCLIIEDSWGTSYGKAGQRVIDEDFLKARNWYASYLMNFKFDDQVLPEPVTPKPKHTFTKVMSYGMSKNPEVSKLQDVLKYEGFFPINTTSTGNYGAVTSKGLLAWQRKHAVAPESELASLAGRRAGDKTLIALNKIYA